eukprot:3886555-Alexandrium_andersonii.AAC.1
MASRPDAGGRRGPGAFSSPSTRGASWRGGARVDHHRRRRLGGIRLHPASHHASSGDRDGH